jgi:hypothetical protein
MKTPAQPVCPGRRHFQSRKIAKGLDNLRFAYRQVGHINFTSIPNTQFNEEHRIFR